MSEAWDFLDQGEAGAAFNMALDEALLETAAGRGRPVLRFYGWSERAASFGYFQKHAEIESLTALRPLVRRPTGGGLVPHDADWTYSLAFPPSHDWYACRASESYERVHEWIRDAFGVMGVQAELAPCCRKTAPGQCFAGYEKFDVLWQGRKIAGAAQRRTRAGLLIQGSVQPPGGAGARAAWQMAMLEVARRDWRVEWVELPAGPALRDHAGRLERMKFGTEAYNRKR
ncbi:MAG: hypothetical protein U1F98_08845 [Verrucomicrobiota bacterium]